MDSMHQELRSHIRSSAVTNFVANLIINGLLAWWTLRGQTSLTAWGDGADGAYGPDLLITGFLLAAIVSAIMMALHRRKLARGELAPVALDPLGWVRLFPRGSLWLACGVFGLLGTLLSALLLAAMLVLQVPPLSPAIYAVIKAVGAGILAALIVPPAILVGLREAAVE
jgi:quinol-cytochrome oxidoreductase complex cytochrome b subunit